MSTLNKAQLKFLRGQSHQIKPIFQVGKQGLSEAFVTQIDQALEKRELIKFTVLQNSDETPEEVAEAVAAALEAEVVQVIGNIGILYRPSSQAKYRELSQQVAAKE